MIKITIAQVGPALAADAAAAVSVELHASATCRLVQYDFRRLTIVGLVAPHQGTDVLLAGHGAPTPHPYQCALSPGSAAQLSPRPFVWSTVIKITIAHVGPALAADVASIELHVLGSLLLWWTSAA